MRGIKASRMSDHEISKLVASQRVRMYIYGITMEDVDAVPQIVEPERVDAEEACDKIYTELPKRFSAETWPRSSNLCCHHCDDIPLSYPKFIPINPQIIDGAPTTDVYGHYCDWQCAAAGVMQKFPAAQHYDLLSAICIFEAYLDKKPLAASIIPAESRTLMTPWAGNGGLTRVQWRDLNRSKKAQNNYLAAKMSR